MIPDVPLPPLTNSAQTQPSPRFAQLGVIGCGLMGGSFALALKAAGLVQHVVGYARSPQTLARALALGVIDADAPSAALAAQGADLVLLAVPVAAMGDTLRAIRDQLSPQTLVMDVGSTKSNVVVAARGVLAERLPQFVPAHPIAGMERAGVEHASANLYRGSQVILTPMPETDSTWVARAQSLWQALGARVRAMTPEAHDAAFAAVSHLPHLLAFAAVRALTQQAEAAHYLGLAGPGFRDFTRIAGSDPDVWRDILLANAMHVRAQAQHFRAALDALEATLARGDAQALRDMIADASRVRTAWAAGAFADNPPHEHPCTAPSSSTFPR